MFVTTARRKTGRALLGSRAAVFSATVARRAKSARRPMTTRYAAPAYFTTENASADDARIADSPAVAAAPAPPGPPPRAPARRSRRDHEEHIRPRREVQREPRREEETEELRIEERHARSIARRVRRARLQRRVHLHERDRPGSHEHR